MIKKLIDKIFRKDSNLEELKRENAELKTKLIEKQEHINRTNAYYKKKLREMHIGSQRKS
jgi:hypothetical protein